MTTFSFVNQHWLPVLSGPRLYRLVNQSDGCPGRSQYWPIRPLFSHHFSIIVAGMCVTRVRCQSLAISWHLTSVLITLRDQNSVPSVTRVYKLAIGMPCLMINPVNLVFANLLKRLATYLHTWVLCLRNNMDQISRVNIRVRSDCVGTYWGWLRVIVVHVVGVCLDNTLILASDWSEPHSPRLWLAEH